MVAQPQLSMMTPDPDDFDRFALLPENCDRLFELIAGEIVEVAANPLSSNIAAIMSAFIGIFVLQHNLGHVTGAEGGYKIGAERYIPSVGFISYQRQSELSHFDGYIPNAPDLAVEVLRAATLETDMSIKIANYLAAGTVVWRVKPLERQIAVFVPGAPVIIFGIDDVLDGGDVLLGFALPLKDIFRTPPST